MPIVALTTVTVRPAAPSSVPMIQRLRICFSDLMPAYASTFADKLSNLAKSSVAPAASKSTRARRPVRAVAPYSHPSPRAQRAKESCPLLLCFFVGWLGVLRFYVGKVGTGLIQLFTFGGFGIWMLIDFIVIVMGSFTDQAG